MRNVLVFQCEECRNIKQRDEWISRILIPDSFVSIMVYARDPLHITKMKQQTKNLSPPLVDTSPARYCIVMCRNSILTIILSHLSGWNHQASSASSFSNVRILLLFFVCSWNKQIIFDFWTLGRTEKTSSSKQLRRHLFTARWHFTD